MIKAVIIKIIKSIRLKTIDKKNRKDLTNKDFCVLSSNCVGACILHDIGIEFNSPCVNLWIEPSDFIKYVKNTEHYSLCKLDFVLSPIFISNVQIKYPVARLDDITIYFQHYKTNEEAAQKWYERSKRINYNNIFIIMTDRDGCTIEDLKEFDKLQYKNKVVFTHKKYLEIKSSYYIRGFENEESVGMLMNFKSFSIYKYYDDFDYVKFFN